MSKPTALRIYQTFRAADDAFDGEKSTEFLIAYTADTLKISYGDVVDGLAAVADNDGAK